MCALKSESSGQQGLPGFGAGKVVKLDGGKRLRLDDKADFWPASQRWESLVDGQGDPENGIGLTSLFAFLKRERAAGGRPVAMPVARDSNFKVQCGYCGKPAGLHGALDVFPDRQDLKDEQLWVCWPCNAWVRCHEGGDRPMGTLANEELRAERQSAHSAFDPVWQEGRLTRRSAYSWLAEELGLPEEKCHIGMFDVATCRRVKEIVWERYGPF